MPSLFIANTSNKHNEFLFRLPGIDQIRRTSIPAGGQVKVLSDVNREEIDYVVNQHAAYGLVEASQAHKIDKFSGVLYSIDKPVSLNAMEQTFEKNEEILFEKGHELRKVAAVAANAQIEQTVADARGSGKQKSFEMEVVEVPEEATTKRKMFKEKIKVSKEA